MGSLLLPAHTCRLTGVSIADSAMPYTYRSISPEIRIRNGKDFHLPIKSCNFVLTVFHDGVRSPPSVSFLVGFGQKPSQPKDRYRLYRDFRTQIPSVPVYLFEILFRHEVLHEERAASTKSTFSSRPPRTFAAGLCSHYVLQSTTVIPWRLGWPLFVCAKTNLSYRDQVCLSFSYWTDCHYPFPALCFPLSQLLDCNCSECKTLLPLIKFWYIFCIPQTRPNRR